MTASTGSKVRPRPSNGWPRKVSWPSPEVAHPKIADIAVGFRCACRQNALFAETSCEELSAECRPRAFTSLNAFCAALRDIAHELGLGYIARPTLAFADVSGVADTGRGGVLRRHCSHHPGAGREIGGQWCADDHHAAGHRYRSRHHD